MKLNMYPKLAMDSIRKNKRLYIPYILTCIGMVMMYYIISFLAFGDSLNNLKGGNIMQQALTFGCGVLGIFSLIFLFYTNSFLIKRRKKEFGLYNILGMSKTNVALMLVCETFIIAFISIGIGLVFGILFSKLAELLMINIMHAEATFTFSIEWLVVLQTIGIFAGIFVLLLVNTLRQIHLSQPIELLRSDNAGEKPPQSNNLMAIAGIVILVSAYIIAISIKNPMAAMFMFFIAVIMVIVATYLLFIAGSVTVCKVLKNNKKYYYKTNHFVSVSSMIYRMKRNGAGLASICILCTMVLVMLSSTVCLYAGAENSLKQRYPKNINITIRADEYKYLQKEKVSQLKEYALKTAQDYKVTPQNKMDFYIASFLGNIDGNKLEIASDYTTSSADVGVISLDEYNRLMNQSKTLKADEAMIYTTKGLSYKHDTIRVVTGKEYKIKEVLDDFQATADATMQMASSLFIVVSDVEQAVEAIKKTATFGGDKALSYENYFGFDVDCDEETQIKIYGQIFEHRNKTADKETDMFRTTIESRASEKMGFYDLYGSLFFLGIMLGIVFVFAAVLIIYYKQISEGYEDQSRFEIMQNVGMSKKEIKKSINSQVLTVFFLPLIMSAMHLGFAFPMIYRLLMLFSITNLSFLILTTIGCFAIFSFFYVIVYIATSKAYYSIVSEIKR